MTGGFADEAGIIAIPGGDRFHRRCVLTLSAPGADQPAGEERLADGRTVDPTEVRGLSAETILDYFYDQVVFTRGPNGWKTDFQPERMKGAKLVSDLIDAKTGEKVAEAGAKMTPRLGKKLREAGLAEILVQPEDLIGQYVAEDIIDESTGEIHIEAGDE